MILLEKDSKSQVNIIKVSDLKKIINPTQETSLDDTNSVVYKGFDQIFTKLSWGPINEDIYGSTRQGNIVRFDRNFKEIKRAKVHDGETVNFSFSADYSIIATCGADGAKIVDPETFQILRLFKTDVPMNTVAISPLFTE